MNTVSKVDVRCQLVATPSLLMVKSGCVRWSARQDGSQIVAVSAVRLKCRTNGISLAETAE